ncbi:virion protein US2 [Cacatuid alphaherpesvirus 2]|uniref:Virion protein US2 n=1 Tax=Cacatuid alphaherpesvirus 2 TaxID=2604840 RepID=A0A5B9R4U0_9ALPH|nr:virion protein US2 [Cacatuid alphaherpesvirus 2]QEG54100.1 virion protein US2 [Cacatuid alphaherpesvirus 2]
MAPVRVSVVVPIDANGNFPGSFTDLSMTAWREIINATLKMTEYDDPTVMPVIVRPTDLFLVGAELLLMKRLQRPVVRFGKGDPPGFSPEWSSLESGFYHLASGRRPAHLWIVGHAWLCMMALQLRVPKTLFAADLGNKRFTHGVRFLRRSPGTNGQVGNFKDFEFTSLATECLRNKWPLHLFRFVNLSSRDEVTVISEDYEEVEFEKHGTILGRCCVRKCQS